jgi:hypothetical protein
MAHFCLEVGDAVEMECLTPSLRRVGIEMTRRGRTIAFACWWRVRQRAEFGSVPVLVYTSSPGKAPRGVTRVLQKPMPFERLLSTVQEFCPG